MGLFGLFGYPVWHSLSPVIYRLFAQQIGIRVDYRLWPVHPDSFRNMFFSLKDTGISGCNITAPLKQQAYSLVDKKTARAIQAGAVNVITFTKSGESLGDNTDGIGLVRDLTLRVGCNLCGSSVAIIGAGGASFGIVPALLAAEVETIEIFNRTKANAEYLAAKFDERVKVAQERSSPFVYDLIIYAIGEHMHATLPQGCIDQNTIVYDLSYRSEKTSFMSWAQQEGVVYVSNGLGMLVEQAAESFKLFTGVFPDVKQVLANLKCR